MWKCEDMWSGGEDGGGGEWPRGKVIVRGRGGNSGWKGVQVQRRGAAVGECRGQLCFVSQCDFPFLSSSSVI